MPQIPINIDGVPEPLMVDEDQFKSLSPQQQQSLVNDAGAKYQQGIRSSIGSPQPEADLPRLPYKGSFLPIAEDSEGNMSFDPTAGVLGKLWGGVKASSDLGRSMFEPEAFNQNQLIDKAAEATSLFGISANPAVRAGDLLVPGARMAGDAPTAGSWIPGPLQSAKPTATDVATPTSSELLGAGGAGYKAVRGMGVDYPTAAASRSMDELRLKLNREGFSDVTAPDVFRTLEPYANPPQGAIANLQGLSDLRETLGNIGASDRYPKQGVAATLAKKHLDDFIQNEGPQVAVAGPAADAAATLAEANANYAAGKRSGQLGALEDKALLRAGAANSGLNLDNTIRQRVADLLVNPDKLRGYSPEEVAALREVALGTPTRNAARLVGNWLGGGGGLGSVVSGGLAGAATHQAGGGSLLGLAAGTSVPGLGLLLRKGANAATVRALDRADEMVRQRSPLYRGLLEQFPEYTAVSPLQRSLPVRGLLALPNQDY